MCMYNFPTRVLSQVTSTQARTKSAKQVHPNNACKPWACKTTKRPMSDGRLTELVPPVDLWIASTSWRFADLSSSNCWSLASRSVFKIDLAIHRAKFLAQGVNLLEGAHKLRLNLFNCQRHLIVTSLRLKEICLGYDGPVVISQSTDSRWNGLAKITPERAPLPPYVPSCVSCYDSFPIRATKQSTQRHLNPMATNRTDK